jgi:hypothetical protein
MKLFAKMLIAALVIALLLPFTLLKGKDGSAMLNVRDLSFPSVSLPELSMPDFLSSDLPGLPGRSSGSDDASRTGNDVIYKWTDANGNLQFSNNRPPEGIVYTIKGYDPNLNVIQAVEARPTGPEAVPEFESKKKVTSAKDIASPYSIENIEKLFEDANNIENLLNQRMENQAAEIGQ